jgi:putative DNA primase/helicase
MKMRELKMFDQNPTSYELTQNEYGTNKNADYARVFDWPVPTPLPNKLPPVDEFYSELLPIALRAGVLDIAQRMQCPADFVAAGVLVALSSLVGARVVIRPKEFDDWCLVCQLWGLAIGPPGVKKSPAVGAIMKNMQKLQKKLHAQFDVETKKWERDCQLIDMQNDVNQKQARNKAVDDPEAARALLEPIPKPVRPDHRRLYINDITVEKLGEIAQQNPLGFLIYRDEIFGLLASFDRAGNEQARTFYLQGFDGNQEYTFDRIGRGTIIIDNVCLAIFGSIQPGRMQEYVRAAVSGGSGDDGLIQRFGMTVWPDIDPAYNHVDRRPDESALEAIENIFSRFSDLKSGDNNRPVEWSFSKDAQSIYNDWIVTIETEIRGDSLHPAMSSHLAKYRKLIPALALIFALIDDPDSNRVVQIDHLQRALNWGKYLRTHANRLYSAAITPETQGAQVLLKKILKGQLLNSLGAPMQDFTPREIAVKGWTGLNTPELVRKAANVLCDFDWLRLIKRSGNQSGGRPSERYYINPFAVDGVQTEAVSH